MKFISVFIILLAMLSCTDENLYESSVHEPITPEGKINLKLNLSTGDYHQPLVKNSDSNFENPWIISFKLNVGSDTICQEVVQAQRSGDGYSVQLTASSNPHYLMVIANANKLINNKKNSFKSEPYWKVVSQLSYGDPLTDGLKPLKEPITSIPFTNSSIPMTAFIELDKIDKSTQVNNTIYLQRIISKIYINATKANQENGFTLTGVTVLGVPSIGYLDNEINQECVPPQSLVKYGKKNASDQLLDDLIINNIIDNTTKSEVNDQPIYIFPFLKKGKIPKDFHLLLKGNFGKETRYYKIRIGNEDNITQLIKPNTSLLINIESVKTNGYINIDQAMEFEANTGVVIKLVALENSQEIIADQSFYLGVSNSVYKFYSGLSPNKKEVVTITTNAFEKQTSTPETSLTLVDAENIQLTPGQSFNSNTTNVTVDFLNSKAKGILRVKVGNLTKDILIEKDILPDSNYEINQNGLLIAKDVLTAYVMTDKCVNTYNAAGLALSQNSGDRMLEIESLLPSNLYLFFKKKVGKQLLYIQSQSSSGAVQLTELREDLPAFAGSNIYWNKNKLSFDNAPTESAPAINKENQGVRFVYGSIIPLGTKINGDAVDVKIIYNPTGLELNQTSLPMPQVINKDDGLKQYSNITNYDKGIGDICRYMTARGWVPQGTKWKLPNTKDFQIVVDTWGDTPPPIGSYIDQINTYNGDFKIPYGLNISNLYFPYNGYSPLNTTTSVQHKTGNIPQYRTGSDSRLFSIYNVTNRLSLLSAIPNYSAGVRCLLDESMDPVEYIGLLEYDVNTPDAGNVSEKIASKHFKIGASIQLSNKQLVSSNGKIHTGWRIGNEFYPLGSYLTNVKNDIKAIAVWSYIAGSNIYWDGNKLTFDDIPSSDGIRTPNEQKQGVFFKFGSLIAIGASYHKDQWNVHSHNAQILDPTASDLKWVNNITFEEIKPITIKKGSDSNKGQYLTNPDVHNPSAKVGDICKYLTEKGWAPGAEKGVKWRMPTYKDFDSQIFVFSGDDWTPLQLPANTLMYHGQYSIPTGVYSPSTNIFIPASGARKEGVMQLPKNYGDYWINSVERNGAWAYYFRKVSDRKFLNLTLDLDAALGVRCVRDIKTQ